MKQDINPNHEDALLTQYFSHYQQRAYPLECSRDVEIFSDIERFVKFVLSSNQPGYEIIKDKNRIYELAIGQSFFRRIKSYIYATTPDLFYTPMISLFKQSCNEVGIKDLDLVGPHFLHNGVYLGEFFNKLIEQIRINGKKPQFRDIDSKEAYRASRMFIDRVKYIDALFDNVRSRLITVRVDLEYINEHARTMQPGQAQKDLFRFFNNMKNKPKVFEDLEGYIWKLERSSLGNEHYHILFLFNNNQFKNDTWLALEIGKYWRDITEGRGKVFNCNDPNYKDRMKYLAIGQIDYHDENMRYNLLRVIAYLCKTTQSLKVKIKKRTRTCGRGTWPSLREETRGRKRKYDVSSLDYKRHINQTHSPT